MKGMGQCPLSLRHKQRWSSVLWQFIAQYKSRPIILDGRVTWNLIDKFTYFVRKNLGGYIYETCPRWNKFAENVLCPLGEKGYHPVLISAVLFHSTNLLHSLKVKERLSKQSSNEKNCGVLFIYGGDEPNWKYIAISSLGCPRRTKSLISSKSNNLCS